MMNFDLSNSNVISLPSKSSHLKANEIHIVHLKDVQVADINTKLGMKKALKFFFANNEDLVHEDTIFEPRSSERKTSTNGFPQASEYEMFMAKVRIYASIFAPKLLDDMDAHKLPKTTNWDGLITLLQKYYTEGIRSKKEFKIKLISNAAGYATIPGFFLGVNKSDEIYFRNRFVGEVSDDIKFTDAELKKIEEQKAIQPTKIVDIIPNADAVTNTNGTINSIGTIGGGASAGDGDELASLLAGLD